MQAVKQNAASETVDIKEFVDNVQQLRTFTQPLLTCTTLLDRVRRWQAPALNMLILFFSNILCFFVPTGHHLIMSLTMLGGLAGLGIAHERSGCLRKVLPNNSPDSSLDTSVNGQMDEHVRVLQQYKIALRDVNMFVKYCNIILGLFYKVLKWEEAQLTIKCYTIVAIILGCLYLLPLPWTINLAVNVFFLHDPASQLCQMWPDKPKLQACVSAASLQSNPSTTSLPTVSMGAESGDVSEISDVEDEQGEDSSTSGPDCSDFEVSLENSTNVTDNQVKSRGIRPPSQCTGCGVTFRLLKRRRLCSSCGNHFCNQCTQKVTKALLGATAPSAHSEMVHVCQPCCSSLTKCS